MKTLKGFENSRYQKHDTIIRNIVLDFNQNKAARCGCTEDQAAQIPILEDVLVKAWMIQESGGGDARSLAAWEVDPVQANVPGDWDDRKLELGLKKPLIRNEGDVQTNLKAGIGLLCRKGFGKSGQPPSNRPDGTFDGWATALQRYNGRTDQRKNGKTYSQNYSDTIILRSQSTDDHVPIELP
ncbi:MAG TPA: hypothetical protein VGE55_11545 [Limnobacter sp.]|uniref:hypothetical protein n=1 Tax=Limnobacter sp. TaxID=2003368 RepID=UPI002ED965F3